MWPVGLKILPSEAVAAKQSKDVLHVCICFCLFFSHYEWGTVQDTFKKNKKIKNKKKIGKRYPNFDWTNINTTL